jgi:hypothetical protein
MSDDRFKFRAWDEGANCMVRVMRLYPPFWVEGYKPSEAETTIHKYILMQSTSLHDEEGELIYEGDIIKIEGEIAVITWCDCEWYLRPETDTWCGDWGLEDCGRFKIVGNIYENPELLK